MVVDFSALDFKERPMLVLKNLDGTYIQPLEFAFDVKAKLMYNEVSEIDFELPAYVNGSKTPHYDDVVGMRMIDWIGIGQFILVNPSTKNDGVAEIKSCKAYSLEYELTYKKLFIADGTYNFWNPVSPENTVMDMILELFPSWHVGYIDDALYNKYRTFEVTDQTAYDFMKGTLQETYQCIFDFDTYDRSINVYSVSSMPSTSPILLSYQNLIKEIKIEEDTENIFTCLDVNGADGVDIRSVNPTGKNDLYDLSYFMNESYFDPNNPETAGIIEGYNQWKASVDANKNGYYLLTVAKVINEARLEMARAELTELKNELSTLETQKSVYVEAAAQGIGASGQSDDLTNINTQITVKQADIDAKTTEISEIEAAIQEQRENQESIIAQCSMSTYLTDAQLQIIDRYVKKDAISDDSFVYRNVVSYDMDALTDGYMNAILALKDFTVEELELPNGKTVNRYHGGTITFHSDQCTMDAELIDAVLEIGSDNTRILTASLGYGYISDGDNYKINKAYYNGNTPVSKPLVFPKPCNEDGSIQIRVCEYSTFDRNNNKVDVGATTQVFQYGDDVSLLIGKWCDGQPIKSCEWTTDSDGSPALLINPQPAMASSYVYYVGDLSSATEFESANMTITGDHIRDFTSFDGVVVWHLGTYAMEPHSISLDAGVSYSISDGTIKFPSPTTINKATSVTPGYRYIISVNGKEYIETAPDTKIIEVDGVRYKGPSSVTNTNDYPVTVSVRQLDMGVSMYFTINQTEYAKRAVEWDLMEYGESVLRDFAYPTYTFSVDAANFLALDDFVAFKNKLRLGNRIYVQLPDDKTLDPIVVGVEFSPDSPEDFTILFGDKYSAKDSAFKLVDLLEQSVSMGKSVSLKRINYNSFVESGASSKVHEFMNSALDASVNAVISGADQAVTLDQSGLRLRKSDGNGGFLPEQIWAINNNIVFTDDNWDHAKMAIGHFQDSNCKDEDGALSDLWGIVAPNIVGTLLAGKALVIESEKQDGGVAVFKVDSDGARLYNSQFDLISQYDGGQTGQISLIPNIGLVGGLSTTTSPLINKVDDVTGIALQDGSVIGDLSGLKMDNLPNANFCLDMKGNAFFKGTVHATSGIFKGTIQAAQYLDKNGKDMMSTSGKWTADYLDVTGLNVGNGNLVIDQNGKITLNNGAITWKNGQPGLSTDDVTNAVNSALSDRIPDGITSTYIDATSAASCKIYGNQVYANGAFTICDLEAKKDQNENIVGYKITNTYGSMGYATGRDANDSNTTGVAITSDSGPYMIVTSAGAKISGGSGAYAVATTDSMTMAYGITSKKNTDGTTTFYPTKGIRVNASGCYFTTGNNSWQEIGSGGGTITAKWG